MWAFLKSLPSQFWDSLLSGLKSLKAFLSGAFVMKLWDTLQRSKKLNEQLANILEIEKRRKQVERETSTLSNDATMDELRRDFGPERRLKQRGRE